MVDPIFEYQFRLILIGDSTVGKSSLLKYFTDGRFSEINDPTVGVDFFARLIQVKPGVQVKLQLWDTAGQERFRSITRSYYRNSVGGLLVYDMTRRSTFESLADWLYEARYHMHPRAGVFLLVGHKTDLQPRRVVSYDEGQRFAEQHGLRYIETSARSGHNVESAFLIIAKEIYHHVEEGNLGVEPEWDGIKPGFTKHYPHAAGHDSRDMGEETQRSGCC